MQGIPNYMPCIGGPVLELGVFLLKLSPELFQALVDSIGFCLGISLETHGNLVIKVSQEASDVLG